MARKPEEIPPIRVGARVTYIHPSGEYAFRSVLTALYRDGSPVDSVPASPPSGVTGTVQTPSGDVVTNVPYSAGGDLNSWSRPWISSMTVRYR